jgi:hypothetical protein
VTEIQSGRAREDVTAETVNWLWELSAECPDQRPAVNL